MKKYIYKKGTTMFVIFVFLVTYVLMSIQVSTTGAVLDDLERKERELEKKNHQLSADIISHSSLLRAGEIASVMGFDKPQQTIYLSEAKPVAKLP